MPARTQNGRAIYKGAVAADTLAALSGVNFASVVRVLTAIELLSRHARTPVARVVQLCDVPLDHAYSDGADPMRCEAVNEALKEMRDSPLHQNLKEALRLYERTEGIRC